MRKLKRVGSLTAAHERALVSRFGDRGVSFVLELPETLDKLRRRWNLQLGQPLSDESSQAATFYAWSADDRPLVLKLHLDQGRFERECLALRHWAGGTASLRAAPLPLKEAADLQALLMERVEGKIVAGSPETRGEPQRVAQMLAALHERPAGPAPLPEVEEHLLKRFLRAERQLGPQLATLPLGNDEIRHAQRTLDALQENVVSDDQVVLHGALEPTSVLATVDGLRAVSARPLRGELSYDVAHWALSRVPEPLSEIKWRIGEICAALGVNSERVLMWAQVLAVVNALERYAHDLGDERELEQTAAFVAV